MEEEPIEINDESDEKDIPLSWKSNPVRLEDPDLPKEKSEFVPIVPSLTTDQQL